MTNDHAKQNAEIELDKARHALRAAEALVQLGLADDAVSRAYYAAYHAATAALYSVGVQTKTHNGTHDLLFRHFVTPGRLARSVSKDLAALQRYREQADYSSTIRFDAASAAEEVARAVRVVAAIEALLAG